MEQRKQFVTPNGIVDIIIDDEGTVMVYNPGRTKVVLPFRGSKDGQELNYHGDSAYRFSVEVATPGMFGGPEVILIDEQASFFERPHSLMVEMSKTGKPKMLAQDGIGDWKQQFRFR